MFGADRLTISVGLRNSELGVLEEEPVSFTLTSDTGLKAQGTMALSDTEYAPMEVAVKAQDYDLIHTFTATADPQNAVEEQNESNNSLVIIVTLPGRSVIPQTVPCIEKPLVPGDFKLPPPPFPTLQPRL